MNEPYVIIRVATNQVDFCVQDVELPVENLKQLFELCSYLMTPRKVSLVYPEYKPEDGIYQPSLFSKRDC